MKSARVCSEFLKDLNVLLMAFTQESLAARHLYEYLMNNDEGDQSRPAIVSP
jgi:hypothetical protein